MYISPYSSISSINLYIHAFNLFIYYINHPNLLGCFISVIYIIYVIHYVIRYLLFI